MDSQEARTIVAKELQRYRAMTYQELQRLLKEQDLLEVRGPSGASYQLEVEAIWDDRPGGNLRVFGHIDDRGLRALAPLTEDFIIAPNGSFVGERATIFVKLLDEAVDVWLKPYEQPGDVEKAMADYLAWETDLLPRIERDGSCKFLSVAGA